MPRLWCWSTAEALTLAALAILATTPAARAATVLERTVVHTLKPDDKVEESTRLRVRIDRAEELADWSPYYVYLDENRFLESLEAAAIPTNSGRKKITSRRQDTLDVAGAGTLHSSVRLREVDFPPLPAGSVLMIEHRVEVEPYFPAGSIPLTEGDAVTDLSVEVRGRPDLRWSLRGETDHLDVERLPDGVRITGRELPEADPPELAPAEVREGPVLFYSWGEAGDWAAVGRWYERLLDHLPQGEEEVRRTALELTGEAATPRQRLAALTELVQQKIRYVAVEVGIGGYRPSPPRETLERRWGDCKDKSLLLVDLLRAVEIPAYPALILADENGRIDPTFPTPGQFNHAIVAVPVQALAEGDGNALPGGGAAQGAEPATGSGYLFIDATQSRGGIDWLNPAVQGQDALVVRGGDSALVRTPVLPGLEESTLTAVLTVGPDGTARGGAGLEVTGATAAFFIEALATRPSVEVEGAVRDLFHRLLPGATVGAVSTAVSEVAVPRISLAASVQLESLVQGQGERRSFLLPGSGLAPEPRHLSERREPVVLQAAVASATWTLHLPEDGCRSEGEPLEVDNPVGRFRQTLTLDGSTLTVERRSEIRRRWVEGEELAALQELALAEHRASRRRIRLRCETETGGGDL